MDYKIIDCRFKYEYDGGHIPGAINITSAAALEEMLLSEDRPSPSISAERGLKTVLIFHCELSEMRAPT